MDLDSRLELQSDCAPTVSGNRLIRSFDFFSLKSLAGVYSPHPGGANVFGATPQLATPLLVMANGNNPLVSTFVSPLGLTVISMVFKRHLRPGS